MTAPKALDGIRVLDLTHNARDGTKQTASSVSHLSELAEQLKVSVAGFKV